MLLTLVNDGYSYPDCRASVKLGLRTFGIGPPLAASASPSGPLAVIRFAHDAPRRNVYPTVGRLAEPVRRLRLGAGWAFCGRTADRTEKRTGCLDIA